MKNISLIISWFLGHLPTSAKQWLDGLNNVILRRLRVSGGPLVMESSFNNIGSFPVVDTQAAKRILGYCDCGRVVSPGDGVLFQEISEESPVGDEVDSLKQHTLIRKIEGVSYRVHCSVCVCSKREVKFSRFGILDSEGMLERHAPL